jgi:hypothetical protein
MHVTAHHQRSLRHTIAGIALAIGVSSGALASCGGAEECTPGKSASCACPDGDEGAQVCQDDGTFGPCSCAQGAGGGGSTSSATGSGGSAASSSGSGSVVNPCWQCCCHVGNQTSCDVVGNNSAPSCPITCTGTCSDGSAQQCTPVDCNAP